jgi:hypothetical protein
MVYRPVKFPESKNSKKNSDVQQVPCSLCVESGSCMEPAIKLLNGWGVARGRNNI